MAREVIELPAARVEVEVQEGMLSILEQGSIRDLDELRAYTQRLERVIARTGIRRALIDARAEELAKASEIAEKLRGVFTDEYRLNGHELYVTASIGIVTFPRDGDTVDTLLRHADTAVEVAA